MLPHRCILCNLYRRIISIVEDFYFFKVKECTFLSKDLSQFSTIFSKKSKLIKPAPGIKVLLNIVASL